MKKTIKINISGIVFNVDEDAFEQLSKYLKSIEGHFSRTEEGKEIISDIEARLAELFQECLTDGKEVINMADVERTTGILGEPEEFGDEEDTRESKEDYTHSSFSGRGKRLYRDPDNSVLGGVCSGIAEYFNIDPVIVRIVFAVAFLVYGTGFLVYIVLWIAIPSAETTAQKLEMKGEKINVSNIEKKIREEYEHVKENLKNIPESKYYHKSRSFLHDFMSGIGKIILVFLKFLLIIIGVSFVVAGFLLLIGLFGGFFFSSDWVSGAWGFDSIHLSSFLHKFADPGEINLAMAGIALVIGIPVLAIIYGGIKLIFRFRANNRIIGTSAFTFWLVGLALLVYVGISEGRNFSSYSKTSDSFPIEEFNSRTLYFKLGEINDKYGKDIDSYSSDFDGFDDFQVVKVDNGELFLGRPEFDIERTNSDKPEITVEKISRGVNRQVAKENAKVLKYNIQQDDSLFILDPYFVIPVDKKWRDQSVKIILHLPVGKNVFISESMEDILYNIHNLQNIWDGSMGNKLWEMKQEGLSIIKELPE